jgi:hypothetical protein
VSRIDAISASQRKEFAMSHYLPPPRQRAFEARNSEVLRTIRDCGIYAPAVLESRRQLTEHMARNVLLRQAGLLAPTPPGPLRRWLAERLLALGARLAGAQAVLESRTGAVDELSDAGAAQPIS